MIRVDRWCGIIMCLETFVRLLEPKINLALMNFFKRIFGKGKVIREKRYS